MTLAESIDLFLAEIATELKPATVRTYQCRLSSLRSSMGYRDVLNLRPGECEAWLDRAIADKAPDTVRLTIIATQRWQAWAIDAGQLGSELFSPRQKPGGRQRQALPTKDENRLLLKHTSEEFRPIFRALRLTGARPGELCRATIADLDLQTGEILLADHKTVKKTGKPRRIPVGHPALRAILETAIAGRQEGTIFLRSCGRPWTPPTLSAAYRKARKAAGLRDELVLYLTRHEHGTEMYRRTRDPKAVSDALGHANFSTTMRYMRAQLDVLQENQAKFDEGLE